MSSMLYGGTVLHYRLPYRVQTHSAYLESIPHSKLVKHSVNIPYNSTQTTYDASTPVHPYGGPSMSPFRAGHYLQRRTGVLSSTHYWYLVRYFLSVSKYRTKYQY